MSNIPNVLTVGSPAPSIDAKEVQTGELFNLYKTLKDHKGILLNFFRGNFWHYWHEYFDQITRSISEFAPYDIIFLAIAPDSKKNLKKMQKYPMKFISDLPNGNIARMYNSFSLPRVFYCPQIERVD